MSVSDFSEIFAELKITVFKDIAFSSLNLINHLLHLLLNWLHHIRASMTYLINIIDLSAK